MGRNVSKRTIGQRKHTIEHTRNPPNLMFTTDNLLYDLPMSPRDIAQMAKQELKQTQSVRGQFSIKRHSLGLSSTLKQDTSLTRIVRGVLKEQEGAQINAPFLMSNQSQSSIKQLTQLSQKSSPSKAGIVNNKERKIKQIRAKFRSLLRG